MMKIIEEFIKGKRDNQNLCEDGYIIKPDFIAVIDGVTAKGNHLWDGKTSGRYAMELIREFLSGDVSKMPAKELFENINLVLNNAYHKELSEEIPEEKLRACIIVYNSNYNEIWSYGDCQCIINNTLYQDEKEFDIIFSNKRADILKTAISNGKKIEDLLSNDIGRLAILEDLKSFFDFENKKVKYGYPVLSGGEVITDFIKTYPIKSGDEIVLASDGYPDLKNTLKESETRLQELLKKDPLCIYENVSTKGIAPGNSSFDDRCYIKFIVD